MCWWPTASLLYHPDYGQGIEDCFDWRVYSFLLLNFCMSLALSLHLVLHSRRLLLGNVTAFDFISGPVETSRPR